VPGLRIMVVRPCGKSGARWHGSRKRPNWRATASVPHQIRPADINTATALAVAWISAVVRARVPPSETGLRAIVVESGWLADPRTGEVLPYSSYSGGRTAATWLPDELSAIAWQAVTALSG
jgi:hypothetical protein